MTATQVRECTGCGAVAELAEGVVSTRCGYCDSPLVDVERAREKVDRVAPFRIQKSVAETALAEHLAGHFWAPGEVRRGIVKQHRLRGLLVPFWAYTGVARSQYEARIGVYWWRTETYVDSKGRVRTRQVRETEWFPFSGSAILELEDHLVSASEGLPEAESNALEPFDLGRALPFDPHLVAGWEAELPSCPREAADQTAVEEVRALEAGRIGASLLPGDTQKLQTLRTDVDLERVDLVWLPIWVTSYRHGDKVFRQMVNGQTGSVYGEVPTSATKVVVAVLGALLVLAIAALGVSEWL